MPFFYTDVTEFVSSKGRIRFNDTADKGDINASQLWLDKLDGWTATVSPVAVTSQKAVGDGAYIANKFFSQGRVLMASGVVATDDKVSTEQAWNQLVATAFPLNEDIRITNYGSIQKYSDVRVISDVRPVQELPDGFRFEVDLMSRDSYLYSTSDIGAVSGIVGSASGGFVFPLVFPLDFNIDPQGISNSAIVNNLGNAPSKPIITINGPLDTGWILENTTTGKFISFDVTLPNPASSLTIDFRKQTAMNGSTPVPGLISGDWWDINPGANVIKLFGTYYPTAVYTVAAKSAWR